MGTYRHTITRAGRTYSPARVVCLACWPYLSRSGMGNAIATTEVQFKLGRETGRRRLLHRNGHELAEYLWTLGGRGRRVWLVSSALDWQLSASGLLPLLLAGRIPCDVYYRAMGGAVLAGPWRGGRLTMSDAAGYWRVGVRELARAVGSPMPNDVGTYVDRPTGHQLAQHSADVVASAVAAWVEVASELCPCRWSATAAGLGWSCLLASHLAGKLHVHCDPRVTADERKSYFAGRADCHLIGGPSSAITRLDVNSLYPYAATLQPLPIRLISPGPRSDSSFRECMRQGLLVVARVQLSDPSHDYPARRFGRIVYARGAFSTALCTPDLAAAVQAGAVRSWGPSWLYEPGRPLDGFCRSLYAARTLPHGPAARAAAGLIKSMLVGLIGRFGRQQTEWVECEPPPGGPVVSWGYWRSDSPYGPVAFRKLGGVVQREGPRGEWDHSMVALAAHVTSAARRVMVNLKDVADPDNVLYEDTDSLHVTPAGRSAVEAHGGLLGKGLGELKVEAGPADAWHWGVRHYQIGDKYVCAGLPTLPGRKPEGNRADGARPDVSPAYRGRLEPSGRVKPAYLWESTEG